MSKKITLKTAERDYLKQKEKVSKLEAELKSAKAELKTKYEIYSKIEKEEALNKISKALFANDSELNSRRINDIVDYINNQKSDDNIDKTEKVVTNDNFSEKI